MTSEGLKTWYANGKKWMKFFWFFLFTKRTTLLILPA